MRTFTCWKDTCQCNARWTSKIGLNMASLKLQHSCRGDEPSYESRFVSSMVALSTVRDWTETNPNVSVHFQLLWCCYKYCFNYFFRTFSHVQKPASPKGSRGVSRKWGRGRPCEGQLYLKVGDLQKVTVPLQNGRSHVFMTWWTCRNDSARYRLEQDIYGGHLCVLDATSHPVILSSKLNTFFLGYFDPLSNIFDHKNEYFLG